MLTPAIAIFAATEDQKTQAQYLATQLHLPYISNITTHYDYILSLHSDYISLQKTTEKKRPLLIDFLSKKMQHRRKQATCRTEMLARALGLTRTSSYRIVDTTTGLGRDSFILASLGFEITLLERSPIIHTLLENAMLRASQDPTTACIMKRMHLIHQDAITYLCNATTYPDIIYLDPMFPQRKKSALSKHDMQVFHAIIGEDVDADNLLHAARMSAQKRVVVKRPRYATPLANQTPTFSLSGSSNRFDVYL
jgi:16S rRNA (guanine1516-N2)-methyltransferase